MAGGIFPRRLGVRSVLGHTPPLVLVAISNTSPVTRGGRLYRTSSRSTRHILRLRQFLVVQVHVALGRRDVPKFHQKTHRASRCSASGQAATISVSALLELAGWCQQRCLENQGGERCRAAIPMEGRLKKGGTSCSAEQALGAAAGCGPAGDRPNSGRDDGRADSSFSQEGGIA